jgi:transposase, IS5 family
MKKQRQDLFAAQHRVQKIAQYTKVLDSLNKLVDWVTLTQVVNESTGREGSQPKGGRPPYPTEALVKLIVLQQLYGNLSDEETEYALLDRGSWQRFIGLADARTLPDARTIWHFKNQLAQAGSGAGLFAEVQRQLSAAGLQAKGGQMIDATIVPAPKMHFTKEEKQRLAEGKTPDHWSQKQRAHKDTDAGWTAKRGQWSYGYKAHAHADQKHKLIRVLDVTPANDSDMTHFAPMLDTTPARQDTGKTVHADRGYDSAANRQTLKMNKLRDGVARNDDRKRYDQTDLHARNRKLARIRARVEHVFGAWEQVIGKSIRCVGLVRATAQITLQAVVVNLRRWVTLDTRGASAV